MTSYTMVKLVASLWFCMSLYLSFHLGLFFPSILFSPFLIVFTLAPALLLAFFLVFFSFDRAPCPTLPSHLRRLPVFVPFFLPVSSSLPSTKPLIFFLTYLTAASVFPSSLFLTLEKYGSKNIVTLLSFKAQRFTIAKAGLKLLFPRTAKMEDGKGH